MSAQITLDCLSLHTPDARPLFSDLSLSIGAERIGLVGRNGCGKSTLLQVIAGRQRPASGHVRRFGRIGLLDQHQEVSALSWAEGLGVDEDWQRLKRIARGQPQVDDIELAVWDLESRVETCLRELDLPTRNLDSPLEASSGGERTRLALARLMLARPDVLLLDEPTNNLDTGGRALILQLVREWRGGLVLASHDRDLLEHVDRIVELNPTGCLVSGGGWSSYVAEREARRERLADAVQTAQSGLRQAKNAGQQRAERKARSDGQGRSVRRSGSQSKLILNARREQAQGTDRRTVAASARQVSQAEGALKQAREQLEVVTPLQISIPASGLAVGQQVLTLDNVSLERGGCVLFERLSLDITGPERVQISGANGAGKSSLLALASGRLAPSSGTVSRNVHVALLDQHVGFLEPGQSVRENCQRLNPELSDNAVRSALARFAFRNDTALKSAAVLSGGERMRAGLACLFAGSAMPSLLILDEPTNHLDLEAVELLEAALQSFDGALLIASHDTVFVAALAPDRRVELEKVLTS